MEGKKVVLLVAAHKAVRFPEDDMYCPIQVGSACILRFILPTRTTQKTTSAQKTLHIAS